MELRGIIWFPAGRFRGSIDPSDTVESYISLLFGEVPIMNWVFFLLTTVPCIGSIVQIVKGERHDGVA